MEERRQSSKSSYLGNYKNFSADVQAPVALPCAECPQYAVNSKPAWMFCRKETPYRCKDLATSPPIKKLFLRALR